MWGTAWSYLQANAFFRRVSIRYAYRNSIDLLNVGDDLQPNVFFETSHHKIHVSEFNISFKRGGCVPFSYWLVTSNVLGIRKIFFSHRDKQSLQYTIMRYEVQPEVIFKRMPFFRRVSIRCVCRNSIDFLNVGGDLQANTFFETSHHKIRVSEFNRFFKRGDVFV